MLNNSTSPWSRSGTLLRTAPALCTGLRSPPLPPPTPAAEVEDEDKDEDDEVEEDENKDGDNNEDEDEDEDEDEEDSPPLLLLASFAFFRAADCASSVASEELLLAILGLAMQLLK